MMKTAPPYTRNTRRARAVGQGFTLVELLAVMLIMAVIVSLVVAVGNWVREDAARRKTSTIQAVAMQAVQAFYDEVGYYPGLDEENEDIIDSDLGDDPPDNLDDNKTTNALLEYLQADDNRVDFADDDDLVAAVKATAGELLSDLPDDAIVTDDDGSRFLMDGYEQPMHYDPKGGLGGRRPVLISAGPDGEFGTEDDIRSDGG